MMKEFNMESLEKLVQVSQVFKVMSEPMRLRILYELKGGELAVNDLADRLAASQANGELASSLR